MWPRGKGVDPPVPLHRTGGEYARTTRGRIVGHIGISAFPRRANCIEACVVWGSSNHGDPCRRRRRNPVDFVAKHARQHMTGLQICSGAYPARTVRNYHIRINRVVVVHDAHQRGLWTVDRGPCRFPPSVGCQDRVGVLDGVESVLVADDRAIRLSGQGARL